MQQMENTLNLIRDILRKDGVTGMDSINHCIAFLFNRLLTVDMCKKLNIDELYAFENILYDDDGDEVGDQDLKARVVSKNKVCFLYVLVNDFGFKNIKYKLESPQNLKLIYKKLEELDTKNLLIKYDIIGTIYEMHLKSGTSNSMRDLGQYYTNRLAINYMIHLCDPKMNKGIIETIVDPTMGTGGFLTMAIKFLNDKYKNKIDWTKNKSHIIGFDIDENVRNMALLNVLLECGELCTETLVKQDTLQYDMRFKDGELQDTILEKADVILANEPMGIKSLKYTDFCQKIKNVKIPGTKAEPAFLQLFMESLNSGGRCAVIVPDGVLFNDSKQHQLTRQHLIENFELHKVISLNGDFFLNTGVKTSILFFTNTGNKTKEVEFCEISLKNDKLEENIIEKASYDKIVEKKYSLFVNKYKKEEKIDYGTVEYKKLGEVCEFDKFKKYDTSHGKENGKYKFHTGGATTELYCDNFNVNELHIIQNRTNGSGKCNLTIDKNFSCAKQTLIYRAKNDVNDISTKYIFYYLLTNLNELENGYQGSNHKNISKDFIENLEIPISSLQIQEFIVKKLDVISSNIEISKKIKDSIKNRNIHFFLIT